MPKWDKNVHQQKNWSLCYKHTMEYYSVIFKKENKETTDTCNMDEPERMMSEVKHKESTCLWSHLYEVLEQPKLIHSKTDHNGDCLCSGKCGRYWLERGMGIFSGVLEIFNILVKSAYYNNATDKYI